jgi:hypothetical protein
MDSDRADRVGHRIAEIVHVDPDRYPGTPFADRLEVRQALRRLALSRMSTPSTLARAHSVIGSSVVGVRQVTLRAAG